MYLKLLFQIYFCFVREEDLLWVQPASPSVFLVLPQIFQKCAKTHLTTVLFAMLLAFWSFIFLPATQNKSHVPVSREICHHFSRTIIMNREQAGELCDFAEFSHFSQFLKHFICCNHQNMRPQHVKVPIAKGWVFHCFEWWKTRTYHRYDP